uniref:ENDD1 protein n=1 Tax=Catharus ustulatus TaxID=91951 RepID=A0A8C3Y1D0_CATUS
MLGLLLLLQVLASCLWLGHSEVVNNFINPCVQFFYAQTPPGGGIRPVNAARICQVYQNQYRFVTLYDRTNRIPVYSAYIYQPGPGNRYNSWFVEPQLINQNYRRYMDTEDSIIDTYGITSADIGKSQAIDQDYVDAQGLDRGHLCPSGHQTGDDNKTATFTLTNIVPQYSTLNQGAWKEYEDITMAQKTQGCDTTYVITGAVPGNTDISNGRVNVPSHIWSAACCVKCNKPLRAWGAIAENERSKNKVKVLELLDLENRLAGLYGGKGVTLFKNACARNKAHILDGEASDDFSTCQRITGY